MNKSVAEQIETHYRQLFSRHGLQEPQQQCALRYLQRGYTNQAAIRLTRAGGDHRVLTR